MYGLFLILPGFFKNPIPVRFYEKPEPLKVPIVYSESITAFSNDSNPIHYWTAICRKCGWDFDIKIISPVLADSVALCDGDETVIRINYFNTKTGEYGCKPLIGDKHTYILEKITPISSQNEPDSH